MDERERRKRIEWRRAAAGVLGRALGLAYAAAAGVLLYCLNELRGPDWVLGTLYWAGGAIALSAAVMLVTSWVERGSSWGLLILAMAGFFSALPMIALATGRLVPSYAMQGITARVAFDWPIPNWGPGLVAGLSLALALGAVGALIPLQRR
jgi:hypothetical protein